MWQPRKKKKINEEDTKSALVPKFGEIKCSAEIKSGKHKGMRCDNGAYFLSEKQYLCGMHSSKDTNRTPLLKMSEGEKRAQNKKLTEEMQASADAARSLS